MHRKAFLWIMLLCPFICFGNTHSGWIIVGHYQEDLPSTSDHSSPGWGSYRENSYNNERNFDHNKDFAIDQYRDSQREDAFFAQESFDNYETISQLDTGHIFNEPLFLSDNPVDNYQELYTFYQHRSVSYADCLQKRINAFDAITSDPGSSKQEYQLSHHVTDLLKKNHIEAQLYKYCFGNQLQRIMHQECITLLQEVALVPVQSIAYSYQDVLIECIDAARNYNSTGLTMEALTVADFCWIFLGYSTAILEGVVFGAIDAVQDCLNHPVHTAACVIAGEYVLAYQLSKVLCCVAKISVMCCVNQTAARDEWNSYVQPLRNTWCAIKQGEISIQDALRGSARFGTCFVAQSRLLGGLGKLYKAVEFKALEWAKNNSIFTPQEYMTTPDGQLFKVLSRKGNEQTKLSTVLKAEGESRSSNKINIKNDVPDFIRYNRVPQDSETILNNKSFKRTNKIWDKARVYEKEGLFYYRDNMHRGKSAHLEVFDKKGIHLGEADPLSGKLIPNTADKTKSIKKIL